MVGFERIVRIGRSAPATTLKVEKKKVLVMKKAFAIELIAMKTTLCLRRCPKNYLKK